MRGRVLQSASGGTAKDLMQMEESRDGGWRMEDGGWRMEDGR
jgi:hypothetical protein